MTRTPRLRQASPERRASRKGPRPSMCRSGCASPAASDRCQARAGPRSCARRRAAVEIDPTGQAQRPRRLSLCARRLAGRRALDERTLARALNLEIDDGTGGDCCATPTTLPRRMTRQRDELRTRRFADAPCALTGHAYRLRRRQHGDDARTGSGRISTAASTMRGDGGPRAEPRRRGRRAVSGARSAARTSRCADVASCQPKRRRCPRC